MDNVQKNERIPNGKWPVSISILFEEDEEIKYRKSLTFLSSKC